MRLEIDDLDRRYAALRIETREAVARLAAAVVRQGLQTAVLVVRDGDLWVLIDGYLRVRALETLGRHEVEAIELAVPEAEALVLRHRLSAARRRSALEDGWLLQELMERHGLRQRELGTRLGRSTSWVSRRLALVRVLPASVQEAVKRGRVPAQGAMKSLVPLARANRSACETLVANLDPEPVSVRQLERLFSAWRQGDDAQRDRIVTHPRLFLQAAAEAETESPDPNDASALLANDLEVVSGTCRRARRRLREGAWVGAEAGQRGHLGRCWTEARAAFDALAHRIDAEERRAGARHADRDPGAAQPGAGDPTDRAAAGGVPQRGEAGGGQRPSGGAGAGP